MIKEIEHFKIALKHLYSHVLGIEQDTNVQGTIDGIKKDITFRGHSAWILIFSIIIASIGLNINSPAVIIGAMLISPLMGPILGIGLSVGTNDFDTLIRSLKNLGIAIFISLATSTIYFMLTPLDIEQTEILARTKPTILDVMVAIFGGFAGIIAGSRKEKSNVIPGVAIATALMPPLCTAGYGLANLKFDYFFGAFYLFFLNSVFISLSTFIIVRRLKFPLTEFVSKQKFKKYQWILVAFLIATITPSVLIFFNVIQEARFHAASEEFISDKCNFKGSELLSHKLHYSDTLSKIDLYFIGEKINDYKVESLEEDIKKYIPTQNKLFPITNKIAINVHQGTNDNIDIEEKMSEFNNKLRINILEDIYTKNEEIVRSKDDKIKLLEDKVIMLSKKDTIPYFQLDKELKHHFPSLAKYAYSRSVELISKDSTTIYDTIPVFLLNFNRQHKYSARKRDLKDAEAWLKIRLNDNKIKVIEY